MKTIRIHVFHFLHDTVYWILNFHHYLFDIPILVYNIIYIYEYCMRFRNFIFLCLTINGNFASTVDQNQSPQNVVLSVPNLVYRSFWKQLAQGIWVKFQGKQLY